MQVASICAGLLNATTFSDVIPPVVWMSLARALFACGLLLGYLSLLAIVNKHWRAVIVEAEQPVQD